MSRNTRNGWKEKLFLFFQLALLTQCQHHHQHHHHHNHQIVPLSTHSISPASVDRKATQGLAAVQRFREILRIQENQNQGINRFPQSLPNPLPAPPSSPLPSPPSQRNPLDGGSEPSGIPEISRPQAAAGVSSLSRPKGQGSLPGIQATGFNGTHTNSFSEQNRSKQINNQQTININDFSSKFQDVGPSSADTRTPEVARVPEIPNHLPIDLVNRLQEFPSLVSAFDESQASATLHAFFEPTQEVRSEELTDEEWHQYLDSEWGSHGVVPSFMTTPPKYVANVNYGEHLCLHLGNNLTPAQARHKPKSFEFPGEANRQYTVMLLDIDHRTGVYINWLSVNVPLNQINKGTDIMEYEQPQPVQTSGVHRMVFLVYLQKTALTSKVPELPNAKACETFNREGVDVDQLTRDLGLEGPTAGNYFLTEWDVTVEHTCRRTS